MADQKVTELPIKNVSGINLADYLFGIDAAEGYQMLISDLAKKIVETYAGSSLAGSSQTLKDALDTVASKAGGNMATIESGTTASKAYAVGDYMVRNGQLYKVTAAIASGGTITVGTNITAAAAANDIAGIRKKIGDTALGTTATTITGAIAEHEQDISGLNSNLSYASIRGADVLTLSSAFASATISEFVIKRVGRIAHVTGIIGSLSIQAERNVIGTLGNGWRPHIFDVFTLGTIGPGGNVGTIVRVEINSNGVLTVVSNVAIASSLRFGCSYVLAV